MLRPGVFFWVVGFRGPAARSGRSFGKGGDYPGKSEGNRTFSVCATVLLEQGHDITIVDNFSTGNRDAVPANATLIEGDIRDITNDVLAEGNFDGVVHFAARSLIGESTIL